MLEYRYNADQPTSIVIEKNGMKIGKIEYVLHSRRWVEIELFDLEDRYHGQGYGQEALKKFFKICEQSGIVKITLETLDYPDFDAAVHIYKKYGFVTKSRKDDWIYMEKTL